MASRNIKPSSVQGFDAANMNDKMQSSTLKRQPSPDWSKADLLRLLSYFEGELQARDVAIATLKAEKAKQLLYQAKYGRFGLGDPFVALQRDAEGKNDTGFDESAIKSMYDNQLAQLENLIATQRKAQLKMREQLGNSEKRFHKVCTELEEEKQKHAQDTAQGDDVTYMLEKERERLKAEIDFEKSQNKKLEKDLKKTLASLEEEKANAARHKQVAIMLIKERKNLIERIVAENQLRDEMESALTDGKSKMQSMAEGLAQESKKSLKMEAAMEKQNSKFDTERETLRIRLQEEEKQTNILRAEVARLSKQLESLQQQVRSGSSSPSSIQMRSSVSPGRGTSATPGRSGASTSAAPVSASSSPQSVSVSLNNNHPQAYSSSSSPGAVGGRLTAGQHQSQGLVSKSYGPQTPKVLEGGRIGSSSPEREVIHRPDISPATGSGARRGLGPGGMRIGPVGAPGSVGERVDVETSSGARVVSISPGSSATVTTHGGGKISFHVSGGGSQATAPSQIRKAQAFSQASSSPAGRGTPPPIPPNKPNFVTPGSAASKPSPPPKVSVVGSSVLVQSPGKDAYSGQYSNTPGKPGQGQRSVQVPVSVVGNSPSGGTQVGPGGAVASVRTQVRETSPSSVRKTSQCVVGSTPTDHPTTTTTSAHAVVVAPQDSSHSLEFLGPEMANLHQLLATMTTGQTSPSNPHVTTEPTTSPVLTSSPSAFTPTSSTAPPIVPKVTSSLNSATVSTAAGPQQSSIQSPLSPHTASAFTATIPAKEQNNNSVKVSSSQQIVKSSAVATAQISPTTTRPQSVPLHIYNDQPTNTPSTYMTHHIVSPTSVTPADVTLHPSHIISPSPALSLPPSPHVSPSSPVVITTQPQSSSISPSQKRRSIPSRSRSKSPLKTSDNHARSLSASSRSSTGSYGLSASQSHSPTHWFLSASPVPSLRLSPAVEVQGSPVHQLSARGDHEALHKLLMERRPDANLALKDGTTPLHCAAENNHEACLKLLLDSGAKPSSLRDDRVTPLHMAALRGYTSCLTVLLTKGAAVNLATTNSQTPLHLAVKAGHLECCQLLLRHGANVLFSGQDGLTGLHYAVQNNQPEMLKALLDRLKLTGTTPDSDIAHHVVALTDKDGWSITHMAAHLPKQDCLVMLAESLPLDFDAKDKLGRCVKVIASNTCKQLLADIDRPASPVVRVAVEMRYILENTTVSNVHLGIMDIGPGIGWRMMEDRLRATLNAYLAQLDVGLKTRRITRLDADLDRSSRDFTLGLTMSNIKQFEMGFYKWTPGMQTDTSPYLMLSNNEHKKITITVDDSNNMCELIAFDVLHPVASINNYLRLLEQYKSAIFYGPAGSGKSYLANRLAQSIAAQELSVGRRPAIYQLTLQPGYSYPTFLSYLKQRNCVVPISRGDANFAPILLVDNLETVDIAQLFGELLDPMEYRGIGHAFCLRGDEQGNNGMHYLADQFYVIGTMNKSRSLGVDLSILPRFRWVQFRLDTEPLRGLLARHFLRRIFNTYHGRLPSPEDPVLRAVEWVVCVWQRLNDSLNKLGLPEVVLGPCLFFKCPLERQDHKLILEWMKVTWNQQIAPRVREAVKRGTGSEAPSDGQQKVANTALYVLMQRSVILSCPLTGQEKDSYLAGFSGSNELDIPLKPGDAKGKASPLSPFGGHLSRSGHPQQQQPQRRPASLETSSSPSQRWRSQGETPPESLSPTPSAIRMRGRNGRDERRSDSSSGASNIKRRSLSESSVNKAAQLEQQQQQQQFLDSMQVPSSSQAKMAKLEVKSPKIVNISSAFRSPSLSHAQSSDSQLSSSGLPLKKTGRVSPLLALVSNRPSNPNIGQKKSRSSENISDFGGGASRLRSPGPFTFSLTTPTSNLSSFKFLDRARDEGVENFTQQMPDFSVFDKVPTPTDELPPSRSFVFVGRPESKERPPFDQSGVQKKEEDEEVWSRRTDVFIPIQRVPGAGRDQRRENLGHKSSHS